MWEVVAGSCPHEGRVPDAAGFGPPLSLAGREPGVEGHLDGAAEDFCAW